MMSISNGDYDGLGKTREEELKKSCALLQMFCPSIPFPRPHATCFFQRRTRHLLWIVRSNLLKGRVP